MRPFAVLDRLLDWHFSDDVIPSGDFVPSIVGLRRWNYEVAREKYYQESRWILCCDASTAIERINRHADAAAESVRRSHGQHFRHLKQWIKQGDQA